MPPAPGLHCDRVGWSVNDATFPGLSPVVAPKEHSGVAAGPHHTGLPGITRTNIPDTFECFTGYIAQLETLLRQMPGFAAILAGVNMRTEPRTVYGRIETLGIAMILRNVIDFPSTEVRAFDLPGFSIPGPADECPLASANPNCDLIAHVSSFQLAYFIISHATNVFTIFLLAYVKFPWV